MKNLFLPNSQELTQIADILNIQTDEVSERIEKGFAKIEIELEETDDAGIPFSEIIETFGYDLFDVTGLVLGRSETKINELFGQLYYKNSLNECPQCGCELESEDGSGHANGKTYEWTDTTCTNSNCDYSDINEPDWDCMPGGADYED